MDSSMSVDEDAGLGGAGEIALPPPIAAPSVDDAKAAPGVLSMAGRGSSIDTDLLEIPVEEFGEKMKIGRGSFGEVFRCQVRARYDASAAKPAPRRRSLPDTVCPTTGCSGLRPALPSARAAPDPARAPRADTPPPRFRRRSGAPPRSRSRS